MQVATIVPTPYLELTKDDDYFMALAHLIVPGEPYAEFFKARAAEGKYVICDNGAAEAAQLPWVEVVKRAMYINANEIILPDTLHNSFGTLSKSSKALEWSLRHDLPFKYMAVPQGETLKEYYMCADVMSGWNIDCIGISKFATKILGPDARADILYHLDNKEINRNIEVHLLGCWNDPTEPSRLAESYEIRGVDSVIAYVFAKRGKLLGEGDRDQFEINFSDGTEIALLKYNIKQWRALNEL